MFQLTVVSQQFLYSGWSREVPSSGNYDDVIHQPTCTFFCWQLQKCGKRFEELHTKYSELYESSFDADPQTLINIQL